MSGNPNYPYEYPLKTLIWISVFVFVFNMAVFKSDFQYYPNSTLSEISDISDIIRIRKNKVPIETSKIYLYY
jgi:hypothetical protein